MSHIPARSELVAPPTAIAALLLLAISHFERLGLCHPTSSEAIASLGVGRTQAYTLKDRLQKCLGELVGALGRPPKPPAEPAPPELATRLLVYLYNHPGAVSGSARRRRYGRGFRLFVLELVEACPEVDRETFASTIAVPLPTLKDWLHGGSSDMESEDVESEDVESEEEHPVVLGGKEAHIATLLDEYKRWNGAFVPFCEHIQKHLHLPFGRTAISTILDANSVRRPARRPRRSPDESALREAFTTYFPNAQWVGDGTELAIVLNGTRHVFNLELITDPYSGAFVGADIRPTEDAAAIVGAFDDARESTEETPMALLLDNKPSNHAPEVVDAIEPTTIIRATPFRPQNKAHIEGGFGLLKSSLGELDITALTPEQFACALLAVMVTAWGRTINHRPRRDRAGRTRAELLEDKPTAEEIKHVQKAFGELARRQERARETLAARQDPVVRAFLAEAFRRLKLDDPKGHCLTAIARYPLDAIVEAVAVFKGRRRAGSLPNDVDARYLLGIARNISQDHEARAIMDALWDARVEAGDLVLQHLEVQREHLVAQCAHPQERVAAYVDKAVTSPWLAERHFWMKAAADVITKQPEAQHQSFCIRASRRIQSTYQLPNRERQAAIRFLIAKVLPLR